MKGYTELEIKHLHDLACILNSHYAAEKLNINRYTLAINMSAVTCDIHYNLNGREMYKQWISDNFDGVVEFVLDITKFLESELKEKPAPQFDIFGKELHEGDFIVYVKGYRGGKLTVGKIVKIAPRKHGIQSKATKNFIQVEIAAKKYHYGRLKDREDNIMYIVQPVRRRLLNLSNIIKIEESQLNEAIKAVLVEGKLLEAIITDRPVQGGWKYSVLDYQEWQADIDNLPYAW